LSHCGHFMPADYNGLEKEMESRRRRKRSGADVKP
jgi:hypothetical protein